MSFHHQVSAAADLHVPGVVSNSDPGAIGAGKFWIDTGVDGSPAAPVIKVRNGTDDGWVRVTVDVSGKIAASIGTTQGDILYYDGAAWVRKALGTAGQRLKSNGTDLVYFDDYYTIPYVIDGGGSAITTGLKGGIISDVAGTITKVTTLALDNLSGSIVVDIWKDTYANHPPTVADSICAAAKPTITAATKAQDSTLTGWTPSIAVGDELFFNVDSASTLTRVGVFLTVKKS